MYSRGAGHAVRSSDPTAVVQGQALGGGLGLAAACDVVLAAGARPSGARKAVGLTPAVIASALLGTNHAGSSCAASPDPPSRRRRRSARWPRQRSPSMTPGCSESAPLVHGVARVHPAGAGVNGATLQRARSSGRTLHGAWRKTGACRRRRPTAIRGFWKAGHRGRQTETSVRIGRRRHRRALVRGCCVQNASTSHRPSDWSRHSRNWRATTRSR